MSIGSVKIAPSTISRLRTGRSCGADFVCHEFYKQFAPLELPTRFSDLGSNARPVGFGPCRRKRRSKTYSHSQRFVVRVRPDPVRWSAPMTYIGSRPPDTICQNQRAERQQIWRLRLPTRLEAAAWVCHRHEKRKHRPGASCISSAKPAS
jgi:hypothetical protein